VDDDLESLKKEHSMEQLDDEVPDLFKAKRVLCIQPHYDDNDIGAGGTLVALHAAGAELIYLTVTDSLAGVVDAKLSDEQAASMLRAEQLAAGALIGVSKQHWLGYPQAGEYDYHALRRQVIRFIRHYQPDFVFTCDPWLPYEAQRDHVQTGLAVAEASLLQSVPRIRVDEEVDARYKPYEISGVVFYFTHTANRTVDITATRQRKHSAIDSYWSHYPPMVMQRLHERLEKEELVVGADGENQYVERLKVVSPGQLNRDIHTGDFG
jgi:LmbE family N-acetylglucosaminyl deacetylase